MLFLNLSFLYFLLIVFGGILNITRLRLDKIFILFYLFFTLGACFFLLPNISDYSRDFNNYYNWFLKIQNEGVEDGFWGKDPIFQYIVLFIQQFFGNNYIIIYSFFFFSISLLKLFFARQLNIGFYYLIFLWLLFGQTFILYEITQIRAGLAISICSFYIIRNLHNRSNLNWIFILSSFFMHQSVAVLILSYLLYLFFNKVILTKKMVLLIYFTGIIFSVFLKNILSNYIFVLFIDNLRASDYLDNTYEGVFDVSLISTFFLLKSLSIFILTYFYDDLDELKKLAVFFSAISCFFYSAFAFNSVFAYRFSEVFIYFSIATMVYPLCIRRINLELKYAWFLCLMVLGGVFFYSSTKILSIY